MQRLALMPRFAAIFITTNTCFCHNFALVSRRFVSFPIPFLRRLVIKRSREFFQTRRYGHSDSPRGRKLFARVSGAVRGLLRELCNFGSVIRPVIYFVNSPVTDVDRAIASGRFTTRRRTDENRYLQDNKWLGRETSTITADISASRMFQLSDKRQAFTFKETGVPVTLNIRWLPLRAGKFSGLTVF